MCTFTRDSTDVTSVAGCDDGGVRATVLIADDHADFRGFARILLEAEGFEVVGEAHDGASALVAAHALKPGVVLLDVQPPDLETHIRKIFQKLDLSGSTNSHRRVLAVLAFLRA